MSGDEHDVADQRCRARESTDEASFLAWCPICSPRQHAARPPTKHASQTEESE